MAARIEHRLCSVRMVMDVAWLTIGIMAAAPRMARLFDPVAPEVNTISSARPNERGLPAQGASATAARLRARTHAREAGLPKLPASVRHSLITAATAASTGVVAA